MKRLGIILLAPAFSSTGFCSESVPTAPSRYQIRYHVTSTFVNRPGESAEGTFTLSEFDGRLRSSFVSLKAPQGIEGFSQDFIFDGQDSLAVNKEAEQANLNKGFTHLPSGLKLPFNFRCKVTYRPVRLSQKALEEYNSYNAAPANFEVLADTDRGEERWIGSTVHFQAGQVRGLDFGPSFAPTATYKFGSYRRIRDLEVPETVEMALLEQRYEDGRVRSRLASEHVFRLDEMTTDVSPSVPTSLESIVPPGSLVTYSGSDGDAGFLFQPGAGPIKQQRVRALALVKRPGRMRTANESPSQSGDPALVPFVLSGSFGVVSVGLLIVNKRRRQL